MSKQRLNQTRRSLLKLACLLVAALCVHDLIFGDVIATSLTKIGVGVQQSLDSFVAAFEDATLARLGAPAR